MPEHGGTNGADRKLFGLAPNVIWMGVVSFLNDLSSDMIFPFIPIFLTSVLGASLTFVGLVEGMADATASLLKIVSGWFSDRIERRKPFAVGGYSLSALAKPLLAAAAAPWHVLAVRFIDRVGKGARDAPRDALISFSTPQSAFGRAFGFHRAMDTAGAALGPIAAFLILPLIHQNYRVLFLLSFVASFAAVIVLQLFVREVRTDGSDAASPARPLLGDIRPQSAVGVRAGLPAAGLAPLAASRSGATAAAARQGLPLTGLGAPFFLFLGIATLASLGKASEAFLILRAREVGIAIAFLPLLYVVFSLVFALLATPLGVLADRVGKRNTFTAGLFVFAAVYTGFALAPQSSALWALFAAYGIYAAMTDGVGRAIVADLVPAERRATAFGIYNAATGAALLPASLAFGYLDQHFGSRLAFSYGAGLALAAALLFVIARGMIVRRVNLTPPV